METQTVEQFLFEQLEKIAPGKYTLANVLQLFKHQLRFPCTHLKGGRTRGPSWAKDYNLSVFKFATGVTEIKCLFNCGLKIRSTDSNLTKAFNELYEIARSQSTNSPAASENLIIMKGGKRVPLDPGPVPTYSDEYRQRIKESTDMFWKSIEQGIESGRIAPGDPILGGVFPHPNPVEAPDSQIERQMKQALAKSKQRPAVLKATVTVQDSVPALEPVVSNTKIRKAKATCKTQSRKRGKKG